MGAAGCTARACSSRDEALIPLPLCCFCLQGTSFGALAHRIQNCGAYALGPLRDITINQRSQSALVRGIGVVPNKALCRARVAKQLKADKRSEECNGR